MSSDSAPPATVLVVDDEALVRNLTVRLLERMGHEVVAASDGSEALRLFSDRGDTIDVVVLDQTMPGMAGHEVLAAIRAAGSDVPVILSSGYESDGPLEELAASGDVILLPKPYRKAELAEALTSALGGGASA